MNLRAWIRSIFIAMLTVTAYLTPQVGVAKETPDQVRERQAQTRERVEASMQKSRDKAAAAKERHPCPLPTELQGQTADGWCAAKGYKDQWGRQQKSVGCAVPAKKANDQTWLFLHRYEHWEGCNHPEGCSEAACSRAYKGSGFARPAE